MFKNFDLSWLLTIPGIFTRLGCLLIIIAILFVTNIPSMLISPVVNTIGNFMINISENIAYFIMG